MEERQRGQKSNSVDETNGPGSRDERQNSFQMAAIRRQFADREMLEVELARRRSADIIASARQSVRESMERSHQQIQGIRQRWDDSSHMSSASNQQRLPNPVFEHYSEPRLGQSRAPDFVTNLGRYTDQQPDRVLGHTWGNRGTFLPSNNAQRRNWRNPNEGLLVNSSTYFRIQIDRSASSGNFRPRAEMRRRPQACPFWTDGGRSGRRADPVHLPCHEDTAADESTGGNYGVTIPYDYPGIRTGRYTQLPVLGIPGHRTTRDAASFVNNPARPPSERYHFDPRLRSNYIDLSEGFYEPNASNDNRFAKETDQVEMPASDAFTGRYSLAEDYLTERSGAPPCGNYCTCEEAELTRPPVMVVCGGPAEDSGQHQSPASYPRQDFHPSEEDNILDWKLRTGAASEVDQSRESGESAESGESGAIEVATSGILASLSDMEQFMQKIEEGNDPDSGPVFRGDDVSMQPEDLHNLWKAIAQCEGVVKAVEEAGGFDAGETLYEWSLDRMDRLSSACHRFVGCLISDLVKTSERSSWKPEEYRVYMDAALLVKRTCEKMKETTADEQQGSLRRPSPGALLQILLIYIRTLRLLLELYAILVRSKPAELMEGDSSLRGALKEFATEATQDLLDFHGLLAHRVPANTLQGGSCPTVGVQMDVRDDDDDDDRMCEWAIIPGDCDSTFPAYHYSEDRRGARGDEVCRGTVGSEAGTGATQNTPCLTQYLLSTSFQNNINGSYIQGLVVPSGRGNGQTSTYPEPRQEAEGGSEGELQAMSNPVGTSANTSAIDSDLSIDGETDRPREGCRPTADHFGQDSSGSNELTQEELSLFRSMLSPATLQLLRGRNIPTAADQEEGMLLALSVQMASRLFADSSPGRLNEASYDGEPVEADTFDVLVSRSSTTLLDDLVQLYINAPTKLLHSRLNVVFEGEPGVDGGALSREFFCLIFRSLIDRTVKDRSVFEGDRGHLLPAVDHVLSEAKVFWIVGILVAQAACNGCHGLPGLCPAVRRFLASGARVSSLDAISQLTTLEDVADLDLRSLLKKVRERTELNEEEKMSLEAWLNRSGFSFVMSEAKIEEAIRRILHYYVFESRMSQLVSIAEGMEELGWRPIPSGFDVEVVFPSGEEITLDDLYRCLLINETPAWRSRDLQRAFAFFQMFCAELHEGKIDRLHLSDLLHFFTGAPYLKSGTNITFSHPDSGVGYPQARTCNQELIIPTRHQTYDDFKAAFTQALLLGSYGFGFA